MKINRRVNKGFTLLEVLLAMAVFSIAGIALLSTAENNFRNMSTLEERMMANWVASNQLVETHVDDKWPPKNNQKGQVELAGRDWYWQQKVVKTTNENMRAVTIEVRLSEDQTLVTASLMTYVAKDKL